MRQRDSPSRVVPWGPNRVHEDYYDASCDHSYSAGDRLRLYVASNDPSNLAGTADAILNPDQSNPLTPFGPNAIRPYMILLAFLTFCLGGLLVAAGAAHAERRPPAITRGALSD